MRLDHTIKTLERVPTIYIFDDISGAFKQMTDAQIDKNFNTLTKVRWVLDPLKGEKPFVPILTYHYSKDYEKKFRAQNTMTVFCDWGMEEKTNIDTIATKGTGARLAIDAFEGVMDTQFDHHYFALTGSNGQSQKYMTDDPLRCACVISNRIGALVVSRKDDVCPKCDVRIQREKKDEDVIVQEVYETYRHYGMKELLRECANQGVTNALNGEEWNAKCFCEERIFPHYDFDPEKLQAAVYRKLKKKPPKRSYRKRKIQEITAAKIAETESLPSSESST